MVTIEKIQHYAYTKRPEGVILDTNVLILFLVGKFKPSLIQHSDLLKDGDHQYTEEDFQLLDKIVKFFKRIIITPHIIAELSSLTHKKEKGIKGPEFIEYLGSVIQLLKSFEERHHGMECLWDTEVKLIKDYGLTDLNLINFCQKSSVPIITNDGPLYFKWSNDVPMIRLETIRNSGYTSLFPI